jgi:hypothetical protein
MVIGYGLLVIEGVDGWEGIGNREKAIGNRQ